MLQVLRREGCLKDFAIEALGTMHGLSPDRVLHWRGFFQSLPIRLRMDLQVIEAAGIQTSAEHEAAEERKRYRVVSPMNHL